PGGGVSRCRCSGPAPGQPPHGDSAARTWPWPLPGRGGSSWFPALAVALGVAYALCGRLAETLPLLEQAVSLSAIRWPVSVSVSPFLWTAEASLLVGRLAEAKRAACRALEHARAHQEQGYKAHTLRP